MPEMWLSAQIGLGLILVIGGLVKIHQMPVFTRAVAAYNLLPQRIVAVMVAAVECAFGLLLVTGIAVAATAAAVGAMLTLFAAAMTINVARGRRNDCGCGGLIGGGIIGWRLIVRNLLLALLMAGISGWGPSADALMPTISAATNATLIVAAVAATSTGLKLHKQLGLMIREGDTS